MCAWRSKVGSALLLVALSGCGDERDADRPSAEAPPAVTEVPVPGGMADADLAGWFIERARYAEALPVVERVVAARREGVGGSALAEALMSLGMVRDALGDSSNALPPLAEAWDLFQAGGAPAATMGACADALGLACHGAGEYGDAEQALLAAIEYREAASPDNPEPWVSASRMHLGRLYLTTARYEEAGILLSQAMESARGNAAIASRARQLGSYYHTLGAYRKAAELFDQSLDAARREYGPESAQVGAVMGDRGLAALREGDLIGARAMLTKSHETIAGLPGPTPDLLATSAENLATFYIFVGEPDKALPLLGDPDDAVGFNNLGSAFQMSGEFDNAGECFERARSLAEAELDAHHPLRVQILQNLACLRFDLGDKVGALSAAREAGAAAVNLLDHLLEFGSEAQRLEFRRTSDPLSLLCSFGAEAGEIGEMLRRTKGVVLDSLLRAERPNDRLREIGSGEVFVDACLYQHYLGRGRWEGRYGAVVEGRWVAMGTERQLGSLLAELRDHIDSAATGSKGGAVLTLEAVLAGLYDFCVRPLGDVNRGLVFSPDGDLRFVPFAALRDGVAFLCENVKSFRVVPSSRSQLPSTVDAKGWALCSVEDYSAAAPDGFSGEMWGRLDALGNLPGVAEEREGLLSVKPFDHLPGTKTELLTALRTKIAPEVLHFSCHGIFLGRGERPLARSCLVVEGKQAIFPAEIAALPLDGTRLVTLSACDTGLGVNMAGEGVLGLQRGFLLAGAENILMTLWAVGDRDLPQLMTAFYHRLGDQLDPARALWSLQRKRLPELTEAEGLARAVWIAGGFSMLSR